MTTTKPRGKKDQELTVTCGWGQGKKVKFLGFADGERGLAITNVGPSTTIITGTPGRGDVVVEMEGERLACWFRNLDPFPARVIVVHEEQGHLDLGRFDDVDTLEKIADLGVKFFRKDHKTVCARLKRMVAKHGEFTWVHYGHKAPVLVVGVASKK